MKAVSLSPSFRTATVFIAGCLLLAESFNPNFLRPAIASRIGFVHLFGVFFGVACILQAVLLVRRLLPDDSN